MASLAAAGRLSARLARSKLPHEAVTVRGFRTSTASLAAQNFTMPALSPTMTEGNIATWRVKEGDKFSAGDVLLEIETDKATMDVEAQEDGFMMKIMASDGAKGVEVGTRIAVIAEEGDDISKLEIPADDGAKQAAPAPKEESKSESVPQEERTASEPADTEAKSSGKAQKQTYPLFPSIIQLLHENGIDQSKVHEIPATGPKGRLLKGDVLVYLGKAKASSAANVGERFKKLTHLDLSNIKVAEKKAAPKKVEEEPAKAVAPVVEDLQVTLSVSLASAIEVQKKVQDTLGAFVPLSTFVARATEVANDELPLAANYKPSADELFNQVLGLDTAGPKGSRGHYLPQISALPAPASFSQKSFSAAKPDIFDILTGGPVKKSAAPKAPTRAPGLSTGVNVFSLKVPKAEEKRARVFLERVKLVLENEPGRLVL
ncbi:Pyruvate dehydrogenase complex protein X component, mitochondrial [Cytospora mali]|uniref:Pyruvate dehydrogenase complex protein X component, mitochondrial n=1 Tax=Cytospora mali TaxID=578113 RepID=A0A194VLH8_CYTMA|nr:Pyruvate dehydrogenase complex protein X component, mitochondrial [Valsa mali]